MNHTLKYRIKMFFLCGRKPKVYLFEPLIT